MHWQYTHFIIPIFIALIISGILAIQGWRLRPASGATWFSMLMLSASIFSFFYGLEILSTDLGEALLWSKMQYIGAQALSVIWLFLTLTYTGKQDWLTKRNIGLIFIIPIITLSLAWTNHLHELIWVNPFLKSNPAFSVLDFRPGAWWQVSMLYANSLLLISTILLIQSLIRSKSLYQRQIITLLLFSGINWLGTGLYIMNIIPYGINPNPLTFSIGGLIITWGLFRYRLVDIMPIAKDTIINKMQEGLIVLNTKNKIVDINPMAKKILSKESSNLIGESINETLSSYPELEEMLRRNEGSQDQHVEMTLYTENMGTRNFDVRATLLRDKREHITGQLIFWHDITAHVQQETALNLLLSITQEVSTAEDFNSSINKTLKLIVEHAHWTFGEAWIPNQDRSMLKNANASYANRTKIKKLKEFNQISQNFTFSPNMGLPGRVWVSKKAEWQQNISALPREIFLRVQYAQKANLKASFGIPILDRGDVVAILIFYMNEVRTKDQYMIDLVSIATSQLGSVLHHKHTEEMMRVQSAALEASSNSIIITNKNGTITWANPAFSQLTGYSMAEILGETPSVLKSGQHPPEFYQNLWKTISSGEAWQGEIINQRKDKSLYTEEQIITPTRNKDGEITNFIAIKKDITQRKEFERKIQEQNTFLSNIIESVANPFYVINVKDYSIEIANSAARALGIERMKTCYALTHKRETPCDGVEHSCPLKTVLKSKKTTSVEHIHLDPEGNSRIMEVHGYPIINEAGEVTQMIEYSLDITARKEAEKALATERNLLRTLIDSIPDLIYAKDINGKFSLANIALAKLTGQSSHENLIGRDEFDTAPHEIASQFLSIEKEIRRTGKPIINHIEKTVDSEKNPLWLSTTKIPLKNALGETTGIVGVSRDITESRRAEEKIRQLSRAVEQSGSAIVITNLNGNIEFANPAFSKVTGYTFEEAIGENTNILSSGKHPSSFYRKLWKTISNGNIWQGEMVNRKKSGELYWEAATISPVQNEFGETTHFLAIKEDISERKAIEKALAQEQEKTDALLRNILPEKVAQEIKESGKAKPVLFENASILFTDFSNFTATAEALSPDELVRLIDYYFTAFDKITEIYKLEKLKTIGDSYMCVSGLPTPTQNHAVAITHAALELLKFVKETKIEHQKKGLPFWDIRVGISSGSVVAGVVGQKKYAYDIWGDAVVMAARMEQSGEIDKVNISERTYELIKKHFNCQYRGEIAAKHKGQVKMYFVDGEKQD